MQVTSSCGHRSVPKCGLHQEYGTSSLKRMAGVSMSQPVGTHPCLDPSSVRCGSNDAENLRRAEGSAIARSEDRDIAIATQSAKLLPGGRGKEHRPRLPALSKNGHLPRLISLLEMLPSQCGQLRDS